MKSVHQLTYETLDLPEEEALKLIGGASITTKRERLKAFLKDHEWDEAAFKSWLPEWNRRQEQPPQAQTPQGLGDSIAKMTTALGIKPCGGCKQRQAFLNKMFPYEVK